MRIAVLDYTGVFAAGLLSSPSLLQENGGDDEAGPYGADSFNARAQRLRPKRIVLSQDTGADRTKLVGARLPLMSKSTQ
jgi:hypothetical protein